MSRHETCMEVIRPPLPADVVRNWDPGWGEGPPVEIPGWGGDYPRDRIARAVRALGNTASREQIEAACGNKKFTRLFCEECEQESGALVRITASCSGTIDLCAACLRLAAEKASEQPGSAP